MTLALSPEDQRNLIGALHAILSPLAHETVDGWRHEVTVALRKLLHADHSSFAIRSESALPLYNPDLDPESYNRFPDWFARMDPGRKIRERQKRFGAWTRRMLWHPNEREFYRSDYYHEFVIPLRAYDAVGLCVVPTTPGAAAHTDDYPVSLYAHHAQKTGRRFGRRGLQLLRLLQPAFQAGVDAFFAFHRRRKDFVRAIDTLQESVFLFAETGLQVHQNPAAIELVQREGVNPMLARAIREAAESVRVATVSKPVPLSLGQSTACRDVDTGRNRYRITACYLDPTNFGDHAPIMVSVAQLNLKLPSVDFLRGRFAVTLQEARVALLLAERKSNAEIAEILSISPNTARHHTEHVLAKLGVHKRHDVLRVLEQADRANQPAPLRLAGSGK